MSRPPGATGWTGSAALPPQRRQPRRAAAAGCPASILAAVFSGLGPPVVFFDKAGADRLRLGSGATTIAAEHLGHLIFRPANCWSTW